MLYGYIFFGQQSANFSKFIDLTIFHQFYCYRSSLRSFVHIHYEIDKCKMYSLPDGVVKSYSFLRGCYKTLELIIILKLSFSSWLLWFKISIFSEYVVVQFLVFFWMQHLHLHLLIRYEILYIAPDYFSHFHNVVK